MSSEHDIREARIKKRDALISYGMDPYPSSVPRTHSLRELADSFSSLEEAQTSISAVGRVMAIRGQGAILFVVLFDGTERFQVVLKEDAIDASLFNLFKEAIDIGDFISVTGTAFRTKRGEPSIAVSEWQIATKALLPLPDKWHGLQDPDEKLRKRYLDLLFDPELVDMVRKRAAFWRVARDFLNKREFLEVETPTLEVTTGGAEATPFKTFHNDFDLPVYLRISVGELWQKRLMAAGIEKTFEVGRIYRNEGTSATHVQEFTNLEFYWAYANHEDGMELVEELYKTIATEVFGTTTFTTREYTFDLADTWQRVSYSEEIKRQTGIDIFSASDEQLRTALRDLDVSFDGDTRERLVDSLWKYCRKSISGPAFLVDVPTLVSPLAKARSDNPEVTERFQVLLAGSEVGNGFSELNDPEEQRKRFQLQQELLQAGDTEAMMPEWDFVEMLEHGMPPTCGFGFGERLFSFLVDRPLRDVQLFPLVRPKQ